MAGGRDVDVGAERGSYRAEVDGAQVQGGAQVAARAGYLGDQHGPRARRRREGRVQLAPVSGALACEAQAQVQDGRAGRLRGGTWIKSGGEQAFDIDLERDDHGRVIETHYPDVNGQRLVIKNEYNHAYVERVVDGSVVTYAACGGDFTGHWYDSLVSVPAEWIPDGWLTPDRMAVLQNTRSQLTLHVSLDQGVTWQHLPVTDQAAIPDALEQLD